MVGKSMFVTVLLLLAVVSPPQRAAAATYNVGDSLGWTIPSSSPSTYSDWASTKTFLVGDILFFSFTTGQHDVTEVTKAGFDSCIGTNPISAVRTGPANITLSAPGTRHFICSISGHCDFGQKLSVTIRSESSSPPTAAPSPSPKPSTPVSPTPSPHTGRPPKASPPTASPPPETIATPPSNIAPSTPPPPIAPPPPNSANSDGGFGLFFSAGLAIVVGLIY